jgi:uncharacterized membrane protein AbrB (regulator of aidB expression)
MKASTIQEITAAVIATIAVVGAMVIAAYPVFEGKQPQDVPQWLSLLIGAIIGAYFTRAASQNGGRQAGTAVVQAAIQAAQQGGLKQP